MRLGLWPNLPRNRRKKASPPVRGPFRLTCAERYSTGNPHWAMDIAPAVWRWAPVRAVRGGVVLVVRPKVTPVTDPQLNEGAGNV